MNENAISEEKIRINEWKCYFIDVSSFFCLTLKVRNQKIVHIDFLKALMMFITIDPLTLGSRSRQE